MSDPRISGLSYRTTKADAWSKIPRKAEETSHSAADRVTFSSAATAATAPPKKKTDFWGWLDRATEAMNAITEGLQQFTGPPENQWMYESTPTRCKPNSPPPQPHCPRR